MSSRKNAFDGDKKRTNNLAVMLFMELKLDWCHSHDKLSFKNDISKLNERPQDILGQAGFLCGKPSMAALWLFVFAAKSWSRVAVLSVCNYEMSGEWFIWISSDVRPPFRIDIRGEFATAQCVFHSKKVRKLSRRWCFLCVIAQMAETWALVIDI